MKYVLNILLCILTGQIASGNPASNVVRAENLASANAVLSNVIKATDDSRGRSDISVPISSVVTSSGETKTSASPIVIDSKAAENPLRSSMKASPMNILNPTYNEYYSSTTNKKPVASPSPYTQSNLTTTLPQKASAQIEEIIKGIVESALQEKEQPQVHEFVRNLIAEVLQIKTSPKTAVLSMNSLECILKPFATDIVKNSIKEHMNSVISGTQAPADQVSSVNGINRLFLHIIRKINEASVKSSQGVYTIDINDRHLIAIKIYTLLTLSYTVQELLSYQYDPKLKRRVKTVYEDINQENEIADILLFDFVQGKRLRDKEGRDCIVEINRVLDLMLQKVVSQAKLYGVNLSTFSVNMPTEPRSDSSNYSMRPIGMVPNNQPNPLVRPLKI